MKILVLHQPFPMGNFKLNKIIAQHLSERGHTTYLLQQLNGQKPDQDYIQQIVELDVDIIYFEMLDLETFKIIETLNCEKILLYASKGVLPKFRNIFDYQGKWFTKLLTNSLMLAEEAKNKDIPVKFFKYYFSALKEDDLEFTEKYNHDCTFLGMGFHRLQSPSYKLDKNIFFEDFKGIDFKIYGNGWPQLSHCGGILPSDDIGKLYYSTKSGFALIGENQRLHGQINNRYTEMAFSGTPILTQNYSTIDWFGAEQYLNFVSSKSDAYETILHILKNPSVYEDKSLLFKRFIVNEHKIFFEKLEALLRI